jgi:multidrug efflux pump subunit AcrA (membrane-fusion protein)
MKQSKNSKTKFFQVVISIILIVIVGSIIARLNANPLKNYESAKVELNDISTYYTFSGSIISKNTQSVIASRMMKIETVKIKKGTIVKKDQVLFETTDGTKIKSRINGTVEQVKVKVDDQVMSGSILCEIYDLNNLEANIKIDEYDVIAITANESVTLTISALNEQQDQTITELSSVATTANGIAFYQAKVGVTSQPQIKVGMSVEVKMLKANAKQVLTIPMAAVMFDQDNQPYVYIANEQRLPIKTILTLGINDGKVVEVLSGLTIHQEVYYTSNNTEDTQSGFMPPVARR